MIKLRWIFCGITLFAAGCMVGPDYHAPATAMPVGFVNPSGPPTTQNSTTTQRPINTVEWWKKFNDPTLDSLVVRAAACNLDLRQAQARLYQARATRGVIGSAQLPEIDANGQYARSGAGRGGSATSFGNNGVAITRPASVRQDFYQYGLDASWELDVFGGVRRSVEAADANLIAAVEDRRDVLVTVIAEVAVDYITLRGYQRQIVIAENNLAAQKRTADVTRRRFGAGFVSRLDVANADAQVYSTEADIPTLQSSAQQTIYALSILLGREPAALLSELSATAPLPLTPPDVPIGLPSELLRRRPDIRRAEAQLHAATAQIGVATAQLYPQFNLVGSLDIEASKLRGLGNWSNNIWSMGPSITWPIFAGGRIVANIQVQNALQQQAFLTYRQTVLTALQEVEYALVAYSKEQQRRKALIEDVAANRQGLDVATRLYTQGQTDFLNVLNSERSLFVAETSLAVSDTTIATDLAALYKALGGGWQIEPSPADLPGNQPGATQPGQATSASAAPAVTRPGA
ncbi:MAG TPA: efflux transporter outer membrane subunit [Tepidisphaeraceae bacterium]|jgi:NodT family efflux transporter outer membrane factor (OMF) lipoprotein|nr:efflux transporter outer membrane subunit [Tepidisphaeraceae bacterium]